MVMQRERIQFKSSMDDSIQEAILIAPSSGKQLHKPVPLVVSLHSWSADVSSQRDISLAPPGGGYAREFPFDPSDFRPSDPAVDRG